MAGILDFCMVSRRPGRYLKTFPEPVASLPFNMGQWRAMATTCVPEITHCEVDPNKESKIKNPESADEHYHTPSHHPYPLLATTQVIRNIQISDIL